jgi:Tfp pilus assembly protein PilO
MLPDFKEERTQKFTTIVFTIIALSFFGLFAISPTLSTITNLNKQLSDNKFVDQQLQTKINSLYALQQSYAQLQPDLTYVYDSIPKDPQSPILIGQIQSLAQSSNVTITGLQSSMVAVPDPSTPTKDYYGFTFSVSATGDYQSLSKFVNSLISMQRIVSVDNYTITRQNQQSTQVPQLNFRGTVYFKQ